MYTRSGDGGETGLYGGRRVPKDSLRVEAYGSVDELNSCIGVAISFSEIEEVADSLRKIQRLLFIAGADLAAQLPTEEVAAERIQRISKDDTGWLERETDTVFSKLPRLTGFILPGGSEVSAHLHLARAVCRRVERRIISASRLEKVNPDLLPFFNRLSTYLFNLARFANISAGRGDELWKEG